MFGLIRLFLKIVLVWINNVFVFGFLFIEENLNGIIA